EHISDDRVVLSMLSFLDRLLSSGAVTPVLCDPSSDFASEIFNLTRTAVGSSTDKFKLTGSVDIYCQLIQIELFVTIRYLMESTGMGFVRVGLPCCNSPWPQTGPALQVFNGAPSVTDSTCSMDGWPEVPACNNVVRLAGDDKKIILITYRRFRGKTMTSPIHGSAIQLRYRITNVGFSSSNCNYEVMPGYFLNISRICLLVGTGPSASRVGCSKSRVGSCAGRSAA
ncbi:unnamed protein product, partial [Nesidiocoris tenuis]